MTHSFVREPIGDRKVTVQTSSGKVQDKYPHAIVRGDIICDYKANPLRNRRSRRQRQSA